MKSIIIPPCIFIKYSVHIKRYIQALYSYKACIFYNFY
ncbi:hypothetical protein H476_1363 [[Clostridium] sordellii VPI 9048]|nr:hypothetical protein H476_1363 [[Clostridium] sordellii VPI 9048] [Paeniclostridium sordellii VPI 9048]